MLQSKSYVNGKLAIKVTARYNSIHDQIHWCARNCIGDWTQIPNESPVKIDFLFVEEKDAAFFALRWSE